MYTITSLLEDRNPNVLAVRDYGRQLHTDWPIKDMEGNILHLMMEHNMPSKIAEQYLSETDRIGIDPWDDNNKFQFLCHAASSAQSLVAPIVTFHYMFLNNLDPVIFDNEDIYYTLLGRLGLQLYQNACFEEIKDLVWEIVELGEDE